MMELCSILVLIELFYIFSLPRAKLSIHSPEKELCSKVITCANDWQV